MFDIQYKEVVITKPDIGISLYISSSE